MLNRGSISTAALPSLLLMLFINACSYTGPDEDGSSTPPDDDGSGTQPLENIKSTLIDTQLSEGSPAQSSQASADLDELESTLRFSLDMRTKEALTVTLSIDESKTSCIDDVMRRPRILLAEKRFNSGVGEFSFDIATIKDDFAEDDCDIGFKLTIKNATKTVTNTPSGKLLIKDDDNPKGNMHLDEASKNVNFGDVVAFDLNNGRRHNGETYEIEQIKGPTANYKVVEDRFKALIPVTDIGEYTGNSIEYIFSVKPQNSPEYKLQYFAYGPITKTTTWESDEGDDVVSNITGVGYEHDHMVSDLSKLMWTVATTSGNRLEINDFNIPLQRDGEPIDSIADNDREKLRKSLVLNDTNKTISIATDSLSTINKYIDDKSIFNFKFQLRVYPDGSDEYQIVNVRLNFRLSKKKLTVGFEGSNGIDLSNGNYKVRLRDLETQRHFARIGNIVGGIATFDAIYSGQYQAELIDLSGAVSGAIGVTLYSGDNEKAATITIRQSASFKDNRVSEAGQITRKAPQCAASGGGFEVSTGAVDVENACEHTFTANELRGTTANQRRQLLVEVTSMEYPSFSSNTNSEFRDYWSFQLSSTASPIVINMEDGGIVTETHDNGRTLKFASECFSLPADATNEAHFWARAANVGDDQLPTRVIARVINCADLFKISKAKLENRGDVYNAPALTGYNNGAAYTARQLYFAHSSTTSNRLTPLISLPFANNGLTSNNTRFGFTLELVPLLPSISANNITIENIELLLQVKTGTHSEQTITLGNISATNSSNPAVTIESITAAINGANVVTGKRVKVRNYQLPVRNDYPVSNENFRLFAVTKVAINGQTYTSDPEALVFDDAQIMGNSKISQFRSLIDLTSLPTAHAQHTSRYVWNLRYSEREDNVGRDGWTLAALWKNLFAREHTAVDCTATPDNVACKAGLSDSSDYLDELRINDISAVHVRCFARITAGPAVGGDANSQETYDNPKCRSILDHWSHHAGFGMDVRYVNESGATGDNGLHGGPAAPNRNEYFSLWQAASVPITQTSTNEQKTAQRNARIRLRNWVLMNRQLIEWIASDMSGTTTPLREVHYGKSRLPANANPKPPSIYTMITGGVLPGYDTPNDAADNMPGVNATWVQPNGVQINEYPPHDDHFHMDFGWPQAGEQFQ